MKKSLILLLLLTGLVIAAPAYCSVEKQSIDYSISAVTGDVDAVAITLGVMENSAVTTTLVKQVESVTVKNTLIIRPVTPVINFALDRAPPYKSELDT